MRDKFAGSMMGLAVGDALGTTVEFSRPGSFDPVTDMVGGGPFMLAPGEWTDDTSMALCLADSLIQKKQFDAADQMDRYIRWRDYGYLSSNGRCFDIGNTIRQALRKYEKTGNPMSGSTDKYSAGNGSLMRLTPVAMFAATQDITDAVQLCGESSRTTHGALTCIDACQYFGGLLIGAFHGVDKATLLSPLYHPAKFSWLDNELQSEVVEVARGSFKVGLKHDGAIRGTGFVIDSLKAALWAFYHTDSFEDGALLVVNLGEDADTTGAIYGQIAGAVYGLHNIPAKWRQKIAKKETILEYAKALYSMTI